METKDNSSYVAEAIEMLGAGYQPAAIIEPPRKTLALLDNGLVDFQLWGWVKTSAKFRPHIKILRGAKHAIWHYLALGVDENGQCQETIKDICEGTGYSHTEVINSLKEMDVMGYLSVKKDKRGNIYTPEFVARGGNAPTESVVKKVDSTPVYQVESTPPLEKSPAIPLRVKRVNTYLSPADFEKMTVPEAHAVKELQLYKRAASFFPGSRTWHYVYQFIRENNLTEQQIKDAATAWSIRGFRAENVKGILEWARDGIPEDKPKGKHTHPRTEPNMPRGFEAGKRFLERHGVKNG